MDTLPMPLDSLAASNGGLDDFRITSRSELLAMIKRLADGNVFVNLNGSDGTVYTTTVWAIDTQREVLSFAADGESPQVADLVEAEDAVAVAYLDNVKVQFDVSGLVIVRGGGNHAVLNCAIPRELYRFQRRHTFRVRPLLRSQPTAHMRHPMIPDMPLALRVIDLSIGGCALFLPEDVPALQPGVLLNGVQLDLDADTRIATSLRLQHVTMMNPDSRGVRLGCEITCATSDITRNLQRYIDQTQKRQRALALGG